MAKKPAFRIEHDSMGELRVPADALWGAQTQRAVQNFPVSGRPMPPAFVQSLALVKASAAVVNAHPGVTHNYLRDHVYNVWFTCIGPSREAVAETLASFEKETGVPVLNLPAERLYKIKVDFRMD